MYVPDDGVVKILFNHLYFQNPQTTMERTNAKTTMTMTIINARKASELSVGAVVGGEFDDISLDFGLFNSSQDLNFDVVY